MSAISRKSLTPLPSYYKKSSGKTKAPAASYTASPAFRSARPSNWKSFLKWRVRVKGIVSLKYWRIINHQPFIGGDMATLRVAAAPQVAAMKVAVISKPGADFEIVEREIPEPGAGHVR